MRITPSDKKIKLLIVDDSAFMRSAISMMVRDEEDIEVIGQGKNGNDGVELTKKLNPDIITMDIEMPRMDGLTALGIIMKEHPTPVLMISSLTTKGAEATLKAFELGAVDFISKEMSFVNVDIDKIKGDLLSKIRHFAKNKKSVTQSLLKHRTLTLDTESDSASKFKFKKVDVKSLELKKNIKLVKKDKAATTRSEAFKALDKIAEKSANRNSGKPQKYKLVCIGTSTGGPIALQNLIPKLPKDYPIPIIIVQHMPPNFTKSLSTRLDAASNLKVKEAEKGEEVSAGTVYIAPGGKHLTILHEAGQYKIHLSESPYGLFHKPSVDVMFSSVANFCKQNILSIVLTGMGKDGLEGARRLKAKGAKIIAEEESTCIVYGMPKVIIEEGFADEALPLGEMDNAMMRVLV